MKILILANGYTGMFNQTIKDAFPAAQIEETGGEFFPKNSPAIVFMGNEKLRLASQIKEIYPEAVLVALLDHDEPEYREAAIRNGVNHLMGLEEVTVDKIRRVLP